jgi:hypothetical protein
MGIGKRLEQDGVHDAEDGCVRADAEGKRDNSDRGEAGRSAQHAQAVADILGQCFEEAHAERVAAVLFDLIESTEF